MLTYNEHRYGTKSLTYCIHHNIPSNFGDFVLKVIMHSTIWMYHIVCHHVSSSPSTFGKWIFYSIEQVFCLIYMSSCHKTGLSQTNQSVYILSKWQCNVLLQDSCYYLAACILHLTAQCKSGSSFVNWQQWLVSQ